MIVLVIYCADEFKSYTSAADGPASINTGMSIFNNRTPIIVGGDLPVLVNLDALRIHNPRKLRDGMAVIVSSQIVPGDRNGGIYVWDDSATAPDDGLTIIRPTTGISSGRWIQSVGRGNSGAIGPKGDKGVKGDQGDGLATVMAPAGSSLVGYAPAQGAAQTVSSILDNYVLAHTFRLPTDPDDTNALRRALAIGVPVRMVAGKGSGTNGDYMLTQQNPNGAGSLINRSNIVLFGDGRNKTILRGHRFSGYVLHGLGSSTDGTVVGNLFNIRISDLGFVGNVETAGFQEHTHLVALSGVSDVTFERCAFSGWRGDAIYIGQGNVTAANYKNERVTVRDCYFDGINQNNRNGISFIDCNTSLVENCYFVRCSKRGKQGWKPGDAWSVMDPSTGPGMPGAIDYEPDNFSHPVIRNNVVRGCTFNNVGGNVGVIAAHIPTLAPTPIGFTFCDNTFIDSATSGAEIYIHRVREVANPLTVADPDMQIVISNNTGSNGFGIYHLYNCKGVIISGNSWSDYRGGNLFGYVNDSRNMKLMNAAVTNDTYTRCANDVTVNRVTNQIFNVYNLKIVGNVYSDCGDGTPFAYLFDFDNGSSSHVTLADNKVTSPTNKTGNTIIVETGHTLTPSTNRQYNNDWGVRTSMTNRFVAAYSDVAQAWTPIVEGHSVAGSCTYSRQYGEYTLTNGWVNGYAEVNWTGHTGTGQIKFSVPLDPVDLNGDAYPATAIIETTGTGVPGANKVIIGQVHGFASTSAGPGSVRLFTVDSTTGAKVAFGMTTNEYKATIRFSYRV